LPDNITGRGFPAKAWCPLAILLLICLGAGLYYPVVSPDHGTDDDGVYFNNPAVYAKGGGWQTAAFYSDLYRPIWRPLTTLSYRLNWQSKATDRTPAAVTNIALLILTGIIILLIFRRLGFVSFSCLAAAIIILAHPGQSESVSRLAGRSELLSNALLLMAFLTHIYLSRKPVAGSGLWRVGGWAAWGALFAAALLAKETALLLPCLAIGYEITLAPAGRRFRITTILLIAVVVTTSWFALRHGVIKGWPDEMKMNPSSDYVSALTEKERLSLSAALPSLYGGMIIGTEEILPSYAHILSRPAGAPPIEIGRPVTFGVSLPGLAQRILGPGIILALIAAFFLLRRRFPVTALGCLWMASSLLMILPILGSHGTVASARFSLMPMIGLLMIVYGLTGHRVATDAQTEPSLRASAVLTLVMLLLAVGCIGKTRQVAHALSSQETFISFISDKAPRSPEPYLFNAAKALQRADFEYAATQLEESLGRFPRNPRALLNLGLIRAQQEKRSAAMRIFGDAAVVARAVMPKSRVACQTHLSAGALMTEQEMNEPALLQFRKAYEIDSTNVDVLSRLGLLILVEADTAPDVNTADQMAAEAVRYLGRALALDHGRRLSPTMRERIIVLKENAEQQLAVAKEFEEGLITPNTNEEPDEGN